MTLFISRRTISTRMLGIATAALMLLGIGAANASTVYPGTDVDWTIGSPLDSLTKIYLDQTLSSNSVTGHVGSQTSLVEVDFTSTTTSLQSGSGWATIKAADTSMDVKDLLVTPDILFDALRFSLNMPSQSTDDVKLTVVFSDDTSEDRDFTCCGGGDELGNGENKILVESTGSLLMKSLRISGLDNLFGGFDQVKQFGISGPDVPAVPVPAAVWLFGTALIGFVGMSRRRKIS